MSKEKIEPKEIIKKARTERGLKQEEVAKELGISSRMYQRYEEGKFPKFKSDKIEELDKFLNTNIYALLYDKKFPSEKAKIDNPITYLDASSVKVTLQDYINLLHRENDRLYTLLNSALSRIYDDSHAALAYQKAWVKYEAERSAEGDKQKEAEIKNKMRKLVDDELENDVGFDSPGETDI